MLCMSILSGLGLSTAFTVMNVTIVDFHGIQSLPSIYMLSGVLLLIVSYLYALAEHRLGPRRLYYVVIILSMMWALSAFLFYLKLNAFSIFYIFLFSAYFGIYLLNNLQFWGVVALLYNARESRATFSLLSVGESIAKIIGYFLAPVIVYASDISTLLLVSCTAFAIALPFWYVVSKKISWSSFEHELHDHSVHHHPSTQMLKGFKSSQFFRTASFFAFMAILVFYLINYVFLVQVESQVKSIEKLALVFGVLYGSGKFINILLRGAVTGRLLNHLGVYIVLFILPVVLLVLHIVGFFASFDVQASSQALLWVFVFSIFIDEVIRGSIVKPTFLVLFQPLSKKFRLLGHTIVKGIAEPLGMLIAGLVLYLFILFFQVSLQWLNFILLVTIVLWVFSTYSMSNAHKSLIAKLVSKKIVNSDTAFFNYKGVLTTTADQSVSSLCYLSRMQGESSEQLSPEVLISYIQSNEISDSEKLEILEYVYSSKDADYLPLLMTLREDDSDLVRRKVLRILSHHHTDAIIDDPALNDRSHRDHAVLTAFYLAHGGLEAALTYGPYIRQLEQSDHRADKILAIDIIDNINDQRFYTPLLQLMEDPDPTVRKKAMQVSGSVGHHKLLRALAGSLDGPDQTTAQNALIRAGVQSIPFIIQKSQSPGSSYHTIKMLERIGHSNAVPWLIKNIDSASFYDRRNIIQALSKTLTKTQSERYQDVLRNTLEELFTILNQLGVQRDQSILWKKALSADYHMMVHSILDVIRCIERDEAFIDALDHVRWGTKAQRVIALEEVEIYLKSHHFTVSGLLLDYLMYQKVPEHSKYEHLPSEILIAMDSNFYSDWLKAITVRFYGQQFVFKKANYPKAIEQEIKAHQDG